MNLSYKYSWLCYTALFDEVQGPMGLFTRCNRLLGFLALRPLLFQASKREVELIWIQYRIEQMNNAAVYSEKPV